MTEAIESGITELESELASRLGDWPELEPSRWQRVQYALRKLEGDGPVFPTFESFIEWVDEDTSAEWEEGEVVFMSPASLRHQMLVGFLHSIIRAFVEHRELGKVLTAPFKMKIPGYGAEPDVLVVLKENEGRLYNTFLDGPADLVIEVVSPESVERDRIKKFNDYEAAGVREYWIIDPNNNSFEFFRLADSRYQSIVVNDDVISSKILPGLRLPLAWIRAEQQPHLLDALRAIDIL